jgi:hypothetical protein
MLRCNCRQSADGIVAEHLDHVAAPPHGDGRRGLGPEEALSLSRLGCKVDVVHRHEALRGSKIMQERAFKDPKITFLGRLCGR